MINLLPSFQKEEMAWQKKIVFTVHLGFALFSAFFSFLLLLFGIYFYFQGKFNEEIALLETKLIFLDIEKEKEISEKNRFLAAILNVEEQKKEFCPLAEEVFNLLPEGITLESFVMSQDNKGAIQFSLSGFSSEREKLISLKEILQDHFSQVTFPTQVWLKEKEIEFSVSFQK